MANLPENYSYSAEHEWIDVPAAEAEGKTVKVGVTEIATDALTPSPVARLSPPSQCLTSSPLFPAPSLP